MLPSGGVKSPISTAPKDTCHDDLSAQQYYNNIKRLINKIKSAKRFMFYISDPVLIYVLLPQIP